MAFEGLELLRREATVAKSSETEATVAKSCETEATVAESSETEEATLTISRSRWRPSAASSSRRRRTTLALAFTASQSALEQRERCENVSEEESRRDMRQNRRHAARQ